MRAFRANFAARQQSDRVGERRDVGETAQAGCLEFALGFLVSGLGESFAMDG